uniref:Uncharacterized protein n=1 Tax=Toxoplasma gondii (strain ATCC 50861 / VEG) TaxID=432359 RepID=A0A0F7V9Q9_TOXGV|nr:TPA: hypothetical protein BN1205_095450 [Toxoplasma gondii VEG]
MYLTALTKKCSFRTLTSTLSVQQRCPPFRQRLSPPLVHLVQQNRFGFLVPFCVSASANKRTLKWRDGEDDASSTSCRSAGRKSKTGARLSILKIHFTRYS